MDEGIYTLQARCRQLKTDLFPLCPPVAAQRTGERGSGVAAVRWNTTVEAVCVCLARAPAAPLARPQQPLAETYDCNCGRPSGVPCVAGCGGRVGKAGGGVSTASVARPGSLAVQLG